MNKNIAEVNPYTIKLKSYVGEREIRGNDHYKYQYPVPQKDGSYRFLYKKVPANQ